MRALRVRRVEGRRGSGQAEIGFVAVVVSVCFLRTLYESVPWFDLLSIQPEWVLKLRIQLVFEAGLQKEAT
jgi:hypothetical protein